MGSASCSFSSPTRSSIFKNEFSLFASFEFIFIGSLFGFLRVIASFSLVSWCGKQAMRTRARQQASESIGDSREPEKFDNFCCEISGNLRLTDVLFSVTNAEIPDKFHQDSRILDNLTYF